MKKYNLRTAIPAQPALPALSGADYAGIADTADIAVRRCKTEREVLDAVRLVFPNAKYVRREPPLDLVAKECLVCERVYYGRSESQYCGNKCASVGHRQYKNPRRTRIQSLRDQCRAGWRRVSEHVAPESFETWLRNFEMRIEQMREQREQDETIKNRPSILQAIIDWHNAHPEMRLKSAKEQWQQWQQAEASMIYANRNE